MPLRAVLENEVLLSHKLSLTSWSALKKSEQRKLLTLPCCGTRAIAKTSPLGTQFFAHYRKSHDCLSKPESHEHLRLKALVASAAESVGWKVVTEFIGESSKGDKWIADVYCTRGRAKIALEIQLSQQTTEQLEIRHARYVDSGVRDAWFMAKSVYQNSGCSSTKAFPRFAITEHDKSNQTPKMTNYELTVEQFVKTLLCGGLEWKDDTYHEVIYYMESKCWKCYRDLKIPVGMGVTENPNFNDFIKTVPNCSTFYEKLIKQIGGTELELLGLTTIGPNAHMKGNAPGFPFCVKCNLCYAPQSNYHTFKKFKEWYRNSNIERSYVTYSKYSSNGRYEIKKSYLLHLTKNKEVS